MIFVVDNYDSFTFNLVQALGGIDPDVRVARNDRFEPREALASRPDAIVVSPGPGRPENAGRTIDTIRAAEELRIPLLGVCLGHQAIAAAHGGIVERAPAPRHGKASRITHAGSRLFAQMSNPFEAARYHSLIVREEGLAPELVVTARSEEGLVMALEHRELPIYGVQFHPESVLTVEGGRLLRNFLEAAARAR